MTPFSRIERGRTLAQLLMLAFSLLSVLVLVVAASLQLAAHFRTQKRALYANQQQIAERASNAVGGFIQEKSRVLAATASLTDPDTTSVAQWDLVLQRLLGLERTFRRVTVSEPDGGAVVSAARYSPTRPGESARDSRSLRFSRRADPDSGAFISDVYIDPVTSEPLASIRVPVFNALREHRKTLTAELNLKFMWDLVDRLEVGRSGYAYVVDEQATLLAFHDTARVLRGESVAGIPTVAEFVGSPAQRTTRGVQIYRGLEASLVVGTYVPLGTPSWAIVTELPWTEAFRDVIAVALITLGIIVAMAVVASLSGRVVSRRLAVPLVSLRDTATRIAGGERSLTASVDGPEEVVALATAFNSMSSQLQQSIEELQAQVSEVAAARDALEASEERLLQAQKMEAVALLAGGVAHDFNNMLAVILGRAELAVRRMGPEDPFRGDFGEIIAVARRSADLTRQLLAFARQQPIAPRVLDLDDTISGVLKLLRPIAGENVELVWKPGCATWPVRMDPAQVDQMLANLVVNARDAIADVGKVVIETGKSSFDASYCAAHPESAPGDYVMLAVSDSGCGMDKETQARIFDPFFTTKQLGKGTGLGLATVHGIVKQNRGFINVYSEPGSGSTFRIYLPRHLSEPSEGAEPARDELVPTGRETILLVEDESPLLQVAVAMLGQLGYVVLAANGPAAALARAREYVGPIHLVITDVVMPEMNGKDLMARLAAIHPGARCLFISGYAADVISHQGLLEEGLHFLQKPFSLQELAVKVRAVLAPRTR